MNVITTIENTSGALITKPGIFTDVSMESYHGNLCTGPSVGGSDLHRMDSRCPAVAYAHWGCNPERVFDGEDDTVALKFGRAFHALILEGEPVFRDRYAIKPEGMNLATKDGKAWKEAHLDKDILSHDEGMRVFAMSRALSRDPLTQHVFESGGAEVTAATRDPFSGLWLKTRPDWLRTDSRLIVNLKTTFSAKPSEWERQAFNFGYHVGAAHSIDILTEITGEPHHYAFVSVEKAPPYCAVVGVFKPEVLEWGRQICAAAAARFMRCIESGVWPGYADSVLELGLPPWAEKQLQNRHESGDFLA